jgi:3-deoxy-alpha-D-manno-octulosonate 8-oxidase
MYAAFQYTLQKCGVPFPMGICADLDDDQMDALYRATVVHEKPLANALGDGWRDVLTREKVYEIFRRM